MNNKLFYFSLLLSALIHAGVVFSLNARKSKPPPKQAKRLEVTYQKIQTVKAKRQDLPAKNLKFIKEPELPKNVKVLTKKTDSLPIAGGALKSISKKPQPIKLGRKIPPKIKTLDLNRKISMTMVKSEKITNPQYLSYNQSMRQKIRQRAYNYIDHPDFQIGEVYLTFLLTSNGRVKDVRVLEEKTHSNEYLRKVAVRSVKESSPFPPFPKGFDYPEFTFNLLISFKD